MADRPQDMSLAELDQKIAELAAKRATASPTRNLVLSTLVDRLLDERWTRTHEPVSQ
jgi:hypothetical protein